MIATATAHHQQQQQRHNNNNANRERSHSYDDSFLHRDPAQQVHVLTAPPRAAETPSHFLYRPAALSSPLQPSRMIPPQSDNNNSTTRRVSPRYLVSNNYEQPNQAYQPSIPPQRASYSSNPAVAHQQQPPRVRSPLHDAVSSAIVREKAAAASQQQRSPRAYQRTTSTTSSASASSVIQDKPFDEQSALLDSIQQTAAGGGDLASQPPRIIPNTVLDTRFRMPAPRVTPPRAHLDYYSTSEDDSSLQVSRPTTEEPSSLSSYEEALQHQPPSLDDDSLFDFRRGGTEGVEEGWRRPVLKPSTPQRNVTRNNNTTKPSPTVSFGPPEHDTIQYYTPDQQGEDETATLDEDDEYMDEDDDDDGQSALADRSLNSLYTKSAESEVEDVLKDIFLIGNAQTARPGRRKVKYMPAVKQQLQQQQQQQGREHDQDEEEDTLPTFEEEEEEEEKPPQPEPVTTRAVSPKHQREGTDHDSSRKSTKSKQHRRKVQDDEQQHRRRKVDDEMEEEDDDPLSSVWNFFFGPDGSRSVEEEEEEEEMVPKKHKEDQGRRNRKTDQSRSMEATTANSNGQTGDYLGCNSPAELCKEEAVTDGGKNFLDYASDFLLGGGSPSRDEGKDESRNAKGKATDGKNVAAKELQQQQEEEQPQAPSLEEDPRLVDLASEAARSMHRIRGQEFDESYDINFPDDIKFNVMDLEMPLGLIFQENDVGCWVTKVLPNGSASINGRVLVGDQLAAIDGISAICMTVNEIAAIIKDKKTTVELTFMRYSGPLHPTIGTVREEGFEVRAKPEAMPQRKTDLGALQDSAAKAYSSNRSVGSQKEVVKNHPVLKMPPLKEPIVAEKKPSRRFRLFGRKKQ